MKCILLSAFCAVAAGQGTDGAETRAAAGRLIKLEALTSCGARLEIPRLASYVTALNAGFEIGRNSAFDGAAERIKSAVHEHGFVVLPGMHELNTQGHLAFTRLFGKPEAHPQRGKPPGLPCMEGSDCLVEVATNDASSEYHSAEIRADHWHSDVTFTAEPPSYTSLLAVEMPDGGRGDTMWACTARAFAALSPALQQTLLPLSAVHRDRSGLGRRAAHPVVRALPGAPAGLNRSLFVNHQFTEGLEGWAAEESAPLLELLLRKQTEPQFVHRYRWQVGDLIVWDNRQTLHHGVFDVDPGAQHPAEVRRMHRTTAAYERPVAAAGPGPAQGAEQKQPEPATAKPKYRRKREQGEEKGGGGQEKGQPAVTAAAAPAATAEEQTQPEPGKPKFATRDEVVREHNRKRDSEL